MQHVAFIAFLLGVQINLRRPEKKVFFDKETVSFENCLVLVHVLGTEKQTHEVRLTLATSLSGEASRRNIVDVNSHQMGRNRLRQTSLLPTNETVSLCYR